MSLALRNNSIAIRFCALISVVVGCSIARSDLITIGTSKDASIFSESNYNSGLGSLYTGVAGSDVGARRALLAFEIAESIPANAVIQSVSLTLTQTRHGPGAIAESLEIRPALAFWGEGTGTTGGKGNAPAAGDAKGKQR